MRESREMLQSNRLPENKEIIAEHEAEVRQAVNEAKRDPELEQILAKVDWGWLKQRFGRILAHTDIDPASLNFVPPDMIESDHTWESEGFYSIFNNQLVVNPEKVREVQELWQVPIELMWLYLLAHEETHAVSKSECVGAFGDVSEYYLRSGYSLYHANEQDESKEFDTYQILDEGITDKLAREIVLEYLEAHPDFADATGTKEFTSKLNDDRWHKKYNLEVSLVELMIDRLARETGVTSKIVWNAMLQGKLEGEDLTHQDFQELARQFFSEKFLHQLKMTEASSDKPLGALSLFKEFNLTSIDPALKAKIEARIQAAQHLQEEKL